MALDDKARRDRFVAAQDARALKLGEPIRFRPEPSAWFLGPKAENIEEMAELVRMALAGHAQARIDYKEEDPEFTSLATRTSDAHNRTRDEIRRKLQEMLDHLRGSIPVASYRNQSHMYWDITMPGAAGYFAGMLYNQNNVAPEGSPVTTTLERIVGQQLCRMLGYDTGITGDTAPWGHITCDGSIANAEGMWMARNLKYLAAAYAFAIRDLDDMRAGRSLTVTTVDNRTERLWEMAPWDLLNLGVDESLAIPARLIAECGLDEELVQSVMAERSAHALGMLEFYRGFLDRTEPRAPVVFVPATAHYSWDKAGTILGLGYSAVRKIPVDLEGRMRVDVLRRALHDCLDNRIPVLQVVAVLGTTAESAVDPLADILDLRDQMRGLGMEFPIHVDAAWGGYFASMLRAPQVTEVTDQLNAFEDTPEPLFNDHVRRQMEALGRADSITTDPHKAGFLPYPAGSLCYRNGRAKLIISHTSPVIDHSTDVESMGIYGMEGSKPGAAAAGVYLSHAAIPPDRAGYGHLLGRCIFNAKRFYAAVVSMEVPDDKVIVAPFQRLPAERAGGTEEEIAAQIRQLRDHVAGFENADLQQHLRDDGALNALFQEIGPDLTVFAYAFNFRTKDGINEDFDLLNEFNTGIFERLSIEIDAEPGQVPKQDMIVTDNMMVPATYGQDVVTAFAKRLKVEAPPGRSLRFLISTVQNPWLSDTKDGNFIPRLIDVLRKTALEVRDEVIARHGLDAG